MHSHLHIVVADGLTNAHGATGALLWIAQGRRRDYLRPGHAYSAWVPQHCARVNMLVNGCPHCQQLLMNRLRSGAIRLCANAKWFLCTYIRIDSPLQSSVSGSASTSTNCLCVSANGSHTAEESSFLNDFAKFKMLNYIMLHCSIFYALYFIVLFSWLE